MPRTLPFVIIFTFLPVVAAQAGVEDEWADLYSQAQLAAASKDYAKAEAIFDKALRDAELFGKNDARVASTAESLGVVLRSEKKLTEAEEAIRRAAAIYSDNPGESSLEYARSQFDLAGVLMDEGKYEPALQSLNRLLPVFGRSLGPDDNKTAAALCMQGDAFLMLKRYASAEAPLRRCAEIQSEDGDVGSPAFGEAANSLALVYQHLGENSEADRYFTYAEKIREKTLGLLSPELADTLEAHAALLRQSGRENDARQKEKLAAAIRAHAGRK